MGAQLNVVVDSVGDVDNVGDESLVDVVAVSPPTTSASSCSDKFRASEPAGPGRTRCITLGEFS